MRKKEWYLLKEVAEIKEVSTQTIRNWIAAGEIKTGTLRKAGYRRPPVVVRLSDINDYLGSEEVVL